MTQDEFNTQTKHVKNVGFKLIGMPTIGLGIFIVAQMAMMH